MDMQRITRFISPTHPGPIVLLLGFLMLNGCRQFGDPTAIDQDVYGIIEQKWDRNLDSATNYRLDDKQADTVVPVPSRNLPDLGRLTIAQAAALATSYNRDYQTQKEQLYLSALDLRLTRHQFENLYFGTGTAGVSGNRNDTLLGMEGRVGFNRLLEHGTQVSMSLSAATLQVLSGNLRGGLASILDVAVRQPLLRGSDRDIVMEGLTQAERNVLYAVRGFNRYRQTFVVDILTQYYQTLQYLDLYMNARDYLAHLQELQPLGEKLADAGRISKVEVDRIHQEVISAENRVLQSYRVYQDAVDQFKLNLGVDASVKFLLDEKELSALKSSPLKIPAFTDQQAIDSALRDRLDLINESDRVIDAQRKVTVAKDRLRGDLNLVAGTQASTRRVGDRTTLKNFDDRYNLGLEMDLPFDRTQEETDYRRAMITLQQQQRLYQQKTDEITIEVRQAYRRLKEAADRYKVQNEGQTLAEKRLNTTMTLLKYGRASTRRILNAQEDWLTTKDGVTAALVDYIIATLQFYRDAGILHVKPDGMWEL